ncbi:glycosyltransferase family 4 protein [Brachybacterium massiliense]|uniref:glycosyltransferase family 4 protein n=1 Tax=Brachybacterium massiliense TaxID=1755098 RepID=UPI00148347D3|nr:glycosyltransferase family 4 protein [Brachybacterium massiliense]
MISSVLLLTESLNSNSLGRTYCVWRLATAAGWEVEVVSVEGGEVWAPLTGTDFAAACRASTPARLAEELTRRAPDLLIACKPLPSSLGVAETLSVQLGIPLMVDIDDPDLEYRLSLGQPAKMLAKAALHPRRAAEYARLRRLSKRTPALVSNPWLESIYGGTIMPHVRDDTGPGAAHTSSEPVIGFIGSNKPHKGVPELREAVARLAPQGFTLAVTDDPPEDAAPWEDWTGTTTFAEGQKLVRSVDIVVIPSRDIPMARGQLPAKLMDAMLAGRAVVATELPPLPWGLAGTGRTIPDSSVDALERALSELADPRLRQHLGDAAREHALASYTVSSNLKKFTAACTAAVTNGGAL